jgi:hypothetical protein
MVKAFGEKVFDVIEAEPDRSASIDEFSEFRANQMVRHARAGDLVRR